MNRTARIAPSSHMQTTLAYLSYRLQRAYRNTNHIFFLPIDSQNSKHVHWWSIRPHPQRGIKKLVNFKLSWHCSKPTVVTELLVILVASSCNDGSNGDNDGSGGSSHYYPVGECAGFLAVFNRDLPDCTTAG